MDPFQSKGRLFRSQSYEPPSNAYTNEFAMSRATQKYVTHPPTASTADPDFFQLSNLALDSPENKMFVDSYAAHRMRNTERMCLSPISDRSIEPMSVSDISNTDLGQIDEFDDDLPNPLGSRKCYNDFDDKSVISDGTGWFTAIGTDKQDTGSVCTDDWSDAMSCVSSLTCTTCSHTSASSIYPPSQNGQSITHRPITKTATDADSLSRSENNNMSKALTGSMRHTRIKTISGGSQKYKCWSWFPVINCVLIAGIMSVFVILSSHNSQTSLCSGDWEFNISQLTEGLNQNVYGQHIAIQTVVHEISKLMSNSDKNVTTLSFHGWTGIGKNFISSFIAKQMNQDYVFKIIIPLDFAHTKDVDEHEAKMFSKIFNNIPTCQMVLFIIDEVDKASPLAIAGLHRALKNITNSEIEKTKILVILLSNSGGSGINRFFLDHLLNGQSRDSVHGDDVRKFMLKLDDAQLSHEWYIPLLKDSVINSIVPFLPLEKEHIALCIKRYISETRPMLGAADKDEIVKHVLEQMAFFPQGLDLFSSTGCRGVSLKVDLTID